MKIKAKDVEVGRKFVLEMLHGDETNQRIEGGTTTAAGNFIAARSEKGVPMYLHEDTLVTVQHGIAVAYQVRSTIGGTQWANETRAMDEEDAIRTAKTKALEFVGVRWFMALDVFSMESAEGTLLASVRLGETATEVKVAK